ncbi:MAG: RNA polymerase sigma factor [Lachnospiraceae bacterium]|nr:RNA polymerase sigma factor [Lachnospiraceae bacterium]
MHRKDGKEADMDEKTKAFVEQMITGDESAFDALYHFYSGKLYRMALFLTGNRSDSEDVLQETFVKCYLNRGSLKNPERFEAWIYQILVRTAWRTSKMRKRKGELSYEGLLEQQEETGSRTAAVLQREDRMDGPLEKLLRDETARELLGAVNRLDVKYRTVVLLHYYNGLGTREIAEITGILEGTVKSRLSKARRLLKKCLETELAAGNGREAVL